MTYIPSHCGYLIMTQYGKSPFYALVTMMLQASCLFMMICQFSWANSIRLVSGSLPAHPIPSAVILHRTVKDCRTDEPIRAVENIPLKGSQGQQLYSNFLCRPRKQEQCFEDGTFDRWYDEWCEDSHGRKIKIQ